MKLNINIVWDIFMCLTCYGSVNNHFTAGLDNIGVGQGNPGRDGGNTYSNVYIYIYIYI